jgi:capsular exopolysaccharide synthesis family protein
MRKIIDPLLRFWWLLLLALLAAGVSSYLSVSRMPPVYEAYASLLVGRSISDPNPNSGELYLEQQLANAYANIGSRQIAEPTMKVLGLTALPEYAVRPVANTPLIDIVVSDTNPERAQAVANELAEQLVERSPSVLSEQEAARNAFVNQQLDNLQARIEQAEQDIANAQQQLAEATSARQIEDTQAQLTAQETKLISLQTTYTSLLSNSQQGAVNNLQVLSRAGLPTRPVGPNKPLYVLLACAIALSLAAMAAYAIELLDTRVKTGEELSSLLNAPILGRIPSIRKEKMLLTYTLRNPRSPVADAFRSLRTNLEFMGVNRPVRTLLVTGAHPSAGKSIVATNLALIVAQAQRKVVLVETDLRRPALDTAFGTGEGPGLSDACAGQASLESTLVDWRRFPEKDQAGLASAGISEPDQFRLLPAGTLPPNPAELLASAAFDHLLAGLAGVADLVVLDSPPLLLPDASVLLTKVDGVLLVFKPGMVTRGTVQMMKEHLERSGARLLGIVLNQTERVQLYADYKRKPASPGPSKPSKPDLEKGSLR